MMIYSYPFWLLNIFALLLPAQFKKNVFFLLSIVIYLFWISQTSISFLVGLILFLFSLYAFNMISIHKKWKALISLLLFFLFRQFFGHKIEMSLSYLAVNLIWLFYDLGADVNWKLITHSLFYGGAFVGPIQDPKKIILLDIDQKENAINQKSGALFILTGIILLEISSFYHVNLNAVNFRFLELIKLILTVFNFIFLNFQGSVYIARGVAKLWGINLMSNFKAPYWQKDIKDFWKSWHISLGRFFEEVIFIPMQFTLFQNVKIKKAKHKILLINLLCLLTTWLLISLWHGFTGPFILWGIINACLLILPKFKISLLNRLWMLVWVFITQLLFLSPTLNQFNNLFKALINCSPEFSGSSKEYFEIVIAFTLLMLFQYLSLHDEKITSIIESKYYYLMITLGVMLLLFISTNKTYLLYGQF